MGCPSETGRRHGRCIPDNCRLAAVPQVGSHGPGAAVDALGGKAGYSRIADVIGLPDRAMDGLEPADLRRCIESATAAQCHSSCNARSVSAVVLGRDCVAIQMPMKTVRIPAARFQHSGSPSDAAPTSEAATGLTVTEITT